MCRPSELLILEQVMSISRVMAGIHSETIIDPEQWKPLDQSLFLVVTCCNFSSLNFPSNVLNQWFEFFLRCYISSNVLHSTKALLILVIQDYHFFLYVNIWILAHTYHQNILFDLVFNTFLYSPCILPGSFLVIIRLGQDLIWSRRIITDDDVPRKAMVGSS